MSVLVRGGSAKVQTSIHPEGDGFTPQSSLELTQFCYRCLPLSMTGLSLSTGHLCMCMCVCVSVCNSTSVTNKLGCCSPAD